MTIFQIFAMKMKEADHYIISLHLKYGVYYFFCLKCDIIFDRPITEQNKILIVAILLVKSHDM